MAKTNNVATRNEAALEESSSSSEEDYDTDDDEMACDCVLNARHRHKKCGSIPFTATKTDLEKFQHNGYWIPCAPIEIEITRAERDQGFHAINKYLYTIEVTHGPHKWSVVRDYGDFFELNTALKIHRAKQRVAAPVKRLKDDVKTIISAAGNGEKEMDAKEEDIVHTLPTHASAGNDIAKLAEEEEFSILLEDEVEEEERARKEREETDEKQQARGDRQGPQGTSDEIIIPKEEEHLVTGKHKQPDFPSIPDSMITENNLEQRRSDLEKWLRKFLHFQINRNYVKTARFFEVSRWSLVSELGGKRQEGTVKKRSGGEKVHHSCSCTGIIGSFGQCCENLLPWRKRWLMVKDTYVAYIDPDKEDVHLVLLVNYARNERNRFFVRCGPQETEGMKTGLIVSNLQRELIMKCSSLNECLKWKAAIEDMLKTTGAEFLRRHDYESFAPVRTKTFAEWFVDGRSYFSRVADIINIAKEEIFIAGWWISPQIFMKRPPKNFPKFRLDTLLFSKAQEGVKIYVLLYKEIYMALGLNSYYTKMTLQSHPNIKVIRHPDHVPGGTLLWAHHEKLVVVDQTFAFVGGLDLAHGRWDDEHHVLVDQGIPFATSDSTENPYKLGEGDIGGPADQESERERKEKEQFFVDVWKRKPQKEPKVQFRRTFSAQSDVPGSSSDDKKEQPAQVRRACSVEQSSRVNKMDKRKKRKRWEELTSNEYGCQLSMYEVARQMGKDHDEAMEFHRQLTVERKMRTNSIRLDSSSNLRFWKRKSDSRKNWKKLLNSDELLRAYELALIKQSNDGSTTIAIQEEFQYWTGKDYMNFIVKDFANVDKPFLDLIDRTTVPRMPWHDIHSATYGAAARDVARHFIQRWNAAKESKLDKDDRYPYLVPKDYSTFRIPRNLQAKCEQLNVQVLRSAASWSALLNEPENSIKNCYFSLIDRAQHYIYFENQFFISMTKEGDVHNMLATRLGDRIIKAHNDGENFRVYFMLPLMPAFEGDVGMEGSSALKTMLYFTYKSLTRGDKSLFTYLKNGGIQDPSNYITFASLRTHDKMKTKEGEDKLVSELVYVHSKLMLVDDEHAIIGSANINDRSLLDPLRMKHISLLQLGDRDSEVCLHFSGGPRVESKMDGKPFRAVPFVKNLRVYLMKEHLGLLETRYQQELKDVDFDDPVADDFYNNVWRKTAEENTRIFEEVFLCYPTDKIKSFDDMKKWRKEVPMAVGDPEKAEEALNKISGQLVLFPHDFFLTDTEKLSPDILSKEGMVPKIVYT